MENAKDGFGFTWFGDGRGREPLPQPLIACSGEQGDDRFIQGSSGPAHLLVVVDRRTGRPDVQAEREIRLVVPHAEGARGDNSLQFVSPQRILNPAALRGIELPGVLRDCEAA